MAISYSSRSRALLDSAALERLFKPGPLLQSLVLVAAVTGCLVLVRSLVTLPHVSIVYLVPVLIAATRWGPIPAVAAAVAGVAASAFFFYPPLFDLRVSDPQQVMDLVLFIGVAVVTGHLADSARAHMKAVQRSEGEVRSLYAFSKRLAAASTEQEILAAARDHLSAVLGHRVLLFPMPGTDDVRALSQGADSIPEAVRTKLSGAGQARRAAVFCVDDATGSAWLVRAVSAKHPALGMIAIEVGRRSTDELEALRQQLDAALEDARATLERLDVARALDEARIRSNREVFREAVIGSVSHELRTPLAAILGAVSVLSRTEAVTGDKRLSELSDIIRSETGRLDSDIRKLLDASRISSDGVRPQPAWTDPADVINAALELYRGRGRQLHVVMSDELPLVYVDPVLIEQALRHIVENAAKYSSADSVISVSARDLGGRVGVCVRDEGMGITAEERERLFERFYRSPRHQAVATGSGLGLWIARAFVTSSGGQLSIESAGCNLGTAVSIYLPAPAINQRDVQENDDESADGARR